MSKSASATEMKRAKLKLANTGTSHLGSAKKSDNPKSSDNKPAVAKAIEELRATYAADEKAHRKRVRANICKAYELGLELKANTQQWALFMKKDWTGISGGPPKEKQRVHAVRFALKFMVGNGRGAQKDASFYYRAIKAFVDEGVTPETLNARLKEKSLRDLAASSPEGDRESGKTATLASKKTLKEEPKKPVVGMAKSIAVETASERALLPGKDSYIRADCLLILRAKAESLLRMPLRQPITIKGHLKAVGSRPEIFVTSVKRRTKPNPTS